MRGRLFVNEFLKSRCNISRAEASFPFFVRTLNLMTTESSNLEWLKTDDRKTETNTGRKAKKRGGSKITFVNCISISKTSDFKTP